MGGIINGAVQRIKNIAQNCSSSHCMIHRQALDAKTLSISFKKALDEVVKYFDQQVEYKNELWIKNPFIVNTRHPAMSAKEYETFIELTSDSSLSKRQRVAEVSVDRKTNYRRLYFEIIDVLISKTNERFTEITQLTFFSLLDFSKFEQYINQFPTNAMNSLKDTYGEYFDFAILRSELSIIYSSTEFHKVNIHELWMYLKSTGLSDSLPQVTKLASLIVTIPATSAGAERSFSCLKRVKTHLRNYQSQNRLSDLSLLIIERRLLTTIQKQNLFYDNIIDDFTKKTRIDLIYK
ncbi:hypothetical protein QTP88_029404 [Uroleucon formosanum]